MFSLPNQSIQLARLFSLLSQGERLAHQSAKQQSQLMMEKGKTAYAKFFKQQARQELFHARVFDGTVIWLGNNKPLAKSRHLENYAKHIDSALQKGALAESVLATQVVLESIGKLALEGVDNRMERQHYGLKKIRSIILAQEAEHYDFGQKELLTLMEENKINHETMRGLSNQYLNLAFAILAEAAPLFDSLDSDIDSFKQRLVNEIPDWLSSN